LKNQFPNFKCRNTVFTQNTFAITKIEKNFQEERVKELSSMNSGIAVDRAFFGLTEDGGLAMEMFLIERMASCGD
jgi:hypothetical protein